MIRRSAMFRLHGLTYQIGKTRTRRSLMSIASTTESDIARFYGKGADAYQAGVLDSEGPRVMATAIDLFVKDVSAQLDNLPKPHTILDLGSATGQPGFDLATKNPEAAVTVSDLSDGMVQAAKKVAERLGISNVRCRVVDAEDLGQFEDNSFSAITCSAAIFFVPDWERALQEWARVLKPGGYVALSAWRGPAKNQVARVFGGIIPIIAPDLKAPLMKIHDFDDATPLLKRLEAVGLSGILCREVCVPMVLRQEYLPMALIANAPIAIVLAKYTDQSEAAMQHAVKLTQESAARHSCLRQDGAIDMAENIMHYITARKPS